MKKVIKSVYRSIVKKKPANALAVAREKFPGCIKLGASVSYGEYSTVTMNTAAQLNIGDGVEFRKYCHILMYQGAMLTIHDAVFLNNYCSINCLGSIEIGENTLFGEGVRLYDHNHQYSFAGERLEVKRDQFKIGKIKIGKNCWIGSNVTILNNVEIGDNVIIGANCLIHKSIASNSIVKLNVDLNIS